MKWLEVQFTPDFKEVISVEKYGSLIVDFKELPNRRGFVECVRKAEASGLLE